MSKFKQQSCNTKSINKLLYLNSEKQNWFWSLFDEIGIVAVLQALLNRGVNLFKNGVILFFRIKYAGKEYYTWGKQ